MLLFRVMQSFWSAAPVSWRCGCPKVRTYGVSLAGSPEQGFIEVGNSISPHAYTRHHIHDHTQSQNVIRLRCTHPITLQHTNTPQLETSLLPAVLPSLSCYLPLPLSDLSHIYLSFISLFHLFRCRIKVCARLYCEGDGGQVGYR